MSDCRCCDLSGCECCSTGAWVCVSKPPPTSDLRDRIAQVIDSSIGEGYWEPTSVADAVIAEMQLFREFTWEGSTKLSRVVSKWVADE